VQPRRPAGGFGEAHRIEALHLGAEVVAFEDSGDHVQVRLGDGRTQSGDLLVGADGLRSAVRTQLLWRWRSDLPRIDDLARSRIERRDPLERGVGVNWVGRGAEFLAFYVGREQHYWAGVTKSPWRKGRVRRPQEGSTGPIGDWPSAVPVLITATEDAAIFRNDMYDRRPVRAGARDA